MGSRPFFRLSLIKNTACKSFEDNFRMVPDKTLAFEGDKTKVEKKNYSCKAFSSWLKLGIHLNNHQILLAQGWRVSLH